MASGIPEDVARFLAVNIANVAQLELLLHLRAHSDRAWGADDVAGPLPTRPAVAERDLTHLADRHLVEPVGDDPKRFRYAPGELGAVIDKLADCYARRRTRVVSLIFAEPRDGAASLADAFRLRRQS